MEPADQKIQIATFARSVALFIIIPVMFFFGLPLHATVLEHMKVEPLKNDGFEIVLGFEDKPPAIKSYVLHNPARIVMDLDETASKLKRHHQINRFGVSNITAIQAAGKTRLIVAMDNPRTFSAQSEDKKLRLTFLPERKKIAKTEKKMDPVSEPALKAVDFKRTKQGSGQIIFLTSESNPHISINNSKKQMVTITFADMKLPEILAKRLDVTEFATPVQFIKVGKDRSDIQVSVELSGKYEHISWQSGNRFILNVSEIEKEGNAGSGELKYTGEKLSLNFQNIEIRSVLQLLADEQNFNLVASDAVKGSVTLRLEDVPWDQALKIILRSKGLDKRVEGNVLIVAPAQELASREKESLESRQQIKDLSPLHTELVQINYAKASDMQAILNGSDNNRILSERGSVQVVDRTNSLLINETREKLEAIRALIKKIDIPVRQVMIEARIVEARTDLREELGVSWGKTAVSPTVDATFNGGRSISNVAAALGGSKAISDVFVNLPAQGATSGITLGYVTNSVNLSLSLSALELDSKVKIISQPQVITANKKKAVIKKGEERAYETTSDSGTNTTFKDVTLALEVTPQITPDGRIVMDVDVKNNEVTGQDSKGNPVTSINEINTQLLVNNGQTVVLGGVFKNTLTKSKESVPLLGSLPGIGRLFSRDIDKDEKSELLVFITPRIITEDLLRL